MRIKIQRILKKMLILGLSGAILASGMLGVSAADTYNTVADTSSAEHPNHSYAFDSQATKYVIDTNKKGILHIHKSESSHSLGDVTYTIYRVADIVQGHLDGTGQQVDVEYRSLIEDSTAAKNIIPIPSGLSTAQQLDQWVTDLRDSDDLSKRMSNLNTLPHWSGTTDANGNVTFNGNGAGLPLGIYIVYEAAYPSQITDPQPFVVSIPTTSVDDGNNDTRWPADSDHLAGDNMQGSADNAGIYWIYDVQAHPKNITRDLSVEKHIIADKGAATPFEAQGGSNDPSNDVLTDAEDYEIGDIVQYWIKAEVPSTVGEIEYYYVLDRMSAGQSFVNDVAGTNTAAQMEVWARDLSGNMVYIPRFTGAVENYRVISQDHMTNDSNQMDYVDMYGNSMTIRDLEHPEAYAHQNAFAVLFNTQSLSEDRVNDGTTKPVARYTDIYITYQLVLNEKALVGNPGNVNDAALVLSHTTVDHLTPVSNEVHVPSQNVLTPYQNLAALGLDMINSQCIDTRVYTYAAKVEKIGEGTADMKGVEFELRDSRGNKIPVSQYKAADTANLAMDDCENRVGDYYVDRDAATSAVITIDEDQEVYIYGLEAGVYQLVETKTLNGYQLLKEPIVISIVSDSGSVVQPMAYHANANGEYFQIEAGKGYYILQDGMKLKMDTTGHDAGDYLAVTGDVYSYELAGDDGSMSQNAVRLSTRYDFRYTDSETLTFRSNYGMEEANTAANGIFDAKRGLYRNGLFSLTVLNRHGFNIPSTGGIGTTLFYIVGVLITGAGFLGIVQFKKSKKEGGDAA